MALTRDSSLTLAEGVRFEVRDGRLHLEVRGERDDEGLEMLAILAAFAKPRTMAEAVAKLSDDTAQGFVELSAKVLDLVERGVLAPTGEASFASYEGTFDGAAVHIAMLDDRARTGAFIEALRAAVHPDDVVLDIGTGTGILAAAAAKAGARRVYAVEKGAVAEVARRVMADNGLADRVTVLRGLSTEVALPEPATLLVSEILGNDPFAEGLLAAFQHANAELLAPEARRIPERLEVTLQLAGIDEALKEEMFVSDEALERWRGDYGVDMRALGEAMPPAPTLTYLKSAEVVEAVVPLSAPARVVALDLASVGPHLEARVELVATSDGPVDGLMMAFTVALDAERSLTSDVTQNPTSHWRTPLWLFPEPRRMHEGERLVVRWRHSPTGTRLAVEE